jgi:hypothetical protein
MLFLWIVAMTTARCNPEFLSAVATFTKSFDSDNWQVTSDISYDQINASIDIYRIYRYLYYLVFMPSNIVTSCFALLVYPTKYWSRGPPFLLPERVTSNWLGWKQETGNPHDQWATCPTIPTHEFRIIFQQIPNCDDKLILTPHFDLCFT